MLHDVVTLDLTQEKDEWVAAKVEHLRKIFKRMVERSEEVLVVTYRGAVTTKSDAAAPGGKTVDVEGQPEIWTGRVDDLPDVEPIGMLADEEIQTFIEQRLTHVLKTVTPGERIMINRLLSNWAISVMTSANPQLYVCDIQYVPIWGALATEYFAAGGERFLSTME